jgi:hypothetical protein
MSSEQRIDEHRERIRRLIAQRPSERIEQLLYFRGLPPEIIIFKEGDGFDIPLNSAFLLPLDIQEGDEMTVLSSKEVPTQTRTSVKGCDSIHVYMSNFGYAWKYVIAFRIPRK